MVNTFSRFTVPSGAVNAGQPATLQSTLKVGGKEKEAIAATKNNLDATSIAHLSLPTSTPKNPCSHCGQQHWSWSCPSRSEEEKLQNVVKAEIIGQQFYKLRDLHLGYTTL